MNKFSRATVLSSFLVASIFTFATANAAGEIDPRDANKAERCEALWKKVLTIDTDTKHMEGVVADPANADDAEAKLELAMLRDFRAKAKANFTAQDCPPVS